MNLSKIFLSLLLLATTAVSKPLPFDLHYPNANKNSKLDYERYSELQIWKERGYIPKRGEMWHQKFTFKKLQNKKEKEQIYAFFAKALDINSSSISPKGYATFRKDGSNYALELRVYLRGCEYRLLKEATPPQSIELPTTKAYTFTKNIAVPSIKDFSINKVSYLPSNEVIFNYDQKAQSKVGEFWKIEFKAKNKQNRHYRYIHAHNYKKAIVQLGATILQDNDNQILFSLEHNKSRQFIEIKSYNSAFELTILKEKP